MTAADFDKWLSEQGNTLPLCAWGPNQTKIAIKFAEDMAAQAVRGVLDEALNSGDGSYRP